VCLNDVGVALIVGGACYLVGLLAVLLVPDVGETINGFVTIPSAIAEISMLLYLLVTGVRSSTPRTTLSCLRGSPVEQACSL